MDQQLITKIKNLREYLKITPLSMAQKLNMSLNDYQAFESGDYILDDNRLLACFKYLKLDNIYEKYVNISEKNGHLIDIDFINSQHFNFGSVVDLLALKNPVKLALTHVDQNQQRRDFTFLDIKNLSSQAANYFEYLGLKKQDKVLLVLKSAYQLWYIIPALHKLGATIVPSVHMLKKHDFDYRIKAANIKAIISLDDDNILKELSACPSFSQVKTKITINSRKAGWHFFDEEMAKFSSNYEVASVDKDDQMAIFFTSGTTKDPKAVVHSFNYPLSHIITAKYWQNVSKEGLHYTLSDSGWAKFFWGKMYGQWLCESPVFAYDYEGKFVSEDLLKVLEYYQVNSFCAPATIYRMLSKSNLNNYDLSSIKEYTVAGERLSLSDYEQFTNVVNKPIRAGYGMTEAALISANFVNNLNDPTSVGTLNPMYETKIGNFENNLHPKNEGELLIKPKKEVGLALGYLKDGQVISPLQDGYYHTSDNVCYTDNTQKSENTQKVMVILGRTDDLFKSSGYKISPLEIEEALYELPFIAECAIVGITDEKDNIRGNIITAAIHLKDKVESTPQLINQIQQYVKSQTGSYKYPRKVLFFEEELPKTTSGKISRAAVKKKILS